jgi:hypothetical protein
LAVGLGLALAVIAELSALNLLVRRLCSSFRSPDFYLVWLIGTGFLLPKGKSH